MWDHDGAVPVNSHEGPCQRSRDDRSVDEARISMVAESKGRQVKEVDNEYDLGPDKVATDKQHDKSKVKEVV